MAFNAKSSGGTTGGHKEIFRPLIGHAAELHVGAQGKHIPGHRNFDPDKVRSVFHGSLSRAQELIDRFAGTGTRLDNNRERVDFGELVGTWVSPDGTQRLPTTRGIIHYGKRGAHIVPARPAGVDDDS